MGQGGDPQPGPFQGKAAGFCKKLENLKRTGKTIEMSRIEDMASVRDIFQCVWQRMCLTGMGDRRGFSWQLTRWV